MPNNQETRKSRSSGRKSPFASELPAISSGVRKASLVRFPHSFPVIIGLLWKHGAGYAVVGIRMKVNESCDFEIEFKLILLGQWPFFERGSLH